MPEIHLKQTGFTYSSCGPFPENKERINKKKTKDLGCIYQNELDKGCFQHDMAYGDYLNVFILFKDLNRKTATDKVLRNKVFNIVKNLKHDWCHCGIDFHGF